MSKHRAGSPLGVRNRHAKLDQEPIMTGLYDPARPGHSALKWSPHPQDPMKAACSSCGAQHSLPDKQLVGLPRVQFLCAKCGKSTVVEIPSSPDATQVLTPLPGFARSAGAPRLAGSGGVEASSLQLPTGKAIALSVIAGPSRGLVYSVEKPRVVLGRADADIVINDKEISRWH